MNLNFKVKLLVLLSSIVLIDNVHSQSVRSSYFSLNRVSGASSKIRANSATEIVSTSYSLVNGVEMFTFVKDTNTMIYATVPYGYRINDFVVLDDCIFFCGINFLNNCGYIAIFDVNVSTMNIGGYRFLNIGETSELTKMVAYKVSDSLPRYGAMAIGKTNNIYFPTCVIDLNNYYLDNYWRCGIGYELDPYLTDIALIWDGNLGEVMTVGQSLVLNTDTVVPYIPKMYIRNYKRTGGFLSGMDDVLNTYTNVNMTPISPFIATRLSDNNVAISTILNSRRPSSDGVEIKKIDLNTMKIDNIQFVYAENGTLRELTFFPTFNKLAILKKNTQDLGEIFFADYDQTGTYIASKIYCNDLSLNSIYSYDGNRFFTIGLESNLINSPLLLLQGSIADISDSECVIREEFRASSEIKSIYPNSNIENLPKYSCSTEFEIKYPEIYESTINVRCINYYR